MFIFLYWDYLYISFGCCFVYILCVEPGICMINYIVAAMLDVPDFNSCMYRNTVYI